MIILQIVELGDGDGDGELMEQAEDRVFSRKKERGTVKAAQAEGETREQ